MGTIFAWTGWFLAGLALCGIGHALAAARQVRRFMHARAEAGPGGAAVTVLKPLHLGEPRLSENLESFFAQDYAGKVQIVFGVQDAADPAIAVVKALQARYPSRDTTIVVNGATYGANAKVSNLINMLPAARHDVLVLSDSDINAPRDWLARVVAALEEPGVGLVTCLYRGMPGLGGLWPRLAAMGTTYDFLPNVIMGVSLGLADPCMGSTIALRRKVLEEIGGFHAFVNYLADDYEMGRAVRAQGWRVAIPPLAVDHSADEASAGELFRHELRWMRTIRGIDPAGFMGSFITHAMPLALLAALFLGLRPAGLVVLALALAARLFLKWRIDGIFGASSGSAWLLPLRDLMSFMVFLISLSGETVDWQGARLSVGRGGVISPANSVEAAQ